MSGGIWYGVYCPAGICPGGICPGVFVLMPYINICQLLRYDAMPILFYQTIAYWNISALLS